MSRLAIVAALVLATAARAQTDTVPSPPLPTEPAPKEVSTPPAVNTAPAPAAAEVSPPPGPPAVDAASAPGEIVIPQYPPGVTPPAEGPVQLDPAAYAQWRREKLSFAAGSSVVVQGPNADPVDRVEFYKMVGRPDLAAKQEDGKRRAIWFIVGGVAVATAGVVGGIALSNSNEAPITYSPQAVQDPTLCGTYGTQMCSITNQTWQNWVGLTLVIAGSIGGGVLIALGLVAGNPVTTVAEDQTLVGEYNDLLLQRLAGKKQSSAPAPFSPVPRVGFQPGSGGGMFQAAWAF